MSVLHLNSISIYRCGIASLQKTVNKTCKLRSIRCKSPNITKGLSGHNHIILDIKDVGNLLPSTRNGYPNCKRQFTEEISEKLIYNKCTYKFVSMIVYIDEYYFAFIKRVTGKWESHNDLKERVMAITARTPLQKYSIHMLFYVRISKTIELTSD